MAGPRKGVKIDTGSWDDRLQERHIPRAAPAQVRRTTLAVYALEEATEALSRALTGVLGIKPTGSLERVAERTITTYLKAMAQVQSGSRMKDSTLAIMNMDVGDTIEVAASSKPNLHGQMKTVRRKSEKPDMKWRIRQVRQGFWEITRRPDGAYNKARPLDWSPKSQWLAAIPVGQTRIYAGLTKANQIIGCSAKARARMILEDDTAHWKSRRVETGIEVTRTA